MSRDARLAALERCAVIVAGLYLAGVGINFLTRGDVMYANYLRWPAAAPVAFIIGVSLIIIGFRLRRQA